MFNVVLLTKDQTGGFVAHFVKVDEAKDKGDALLDALMSHGIAGNDLGLVAKTKVFELPPARTSKTLTGLHAV